MADASPKAAATAKAPRANPKKGADDGLCGEQGATFFAGLEAGEQAQMEADGAVFPRDMTQLTNAQLKSLHKIKRKARNKQSARKSRQLEKQRIQQLEQAVLETSEANQSKREELVQFQKANHSLGEGLNVPAHSVGIPANPFGDGVSQASTE